MLTPDLPLLLFMPSGFGTDIGKLAYGVLRYSANPVAAVFDPAYPGDRVGDFDASPAMRPATPVVKSREAALALGPRALVLGTAPPGGRIPEAWKDDLGFFWENGLSLINGLHEPLNFPARPGQFIWNVRVEPAGLNPAQGRARHLDNTRVLTVGADMAVGKMTAGLELQAALQRAGREPAFVATGQIGIILTGAGVALDAVRVDYASAAVEAEVLRYAESPVVIIEGQGSLVHPGSTATLPLMRGSMPTHLLFCIRAGQTHLRRIPEIPIPPLPELLSLYQDLASTGGIFPRPEILGICVNTTGVEDPTALLDEINAATGVLAIDPVRQGADRLAALLP